jgi:phosphohistidine phosphatase
LVSTATRTRQTWQLASAAWARPPHCRFDGRIYDASVDDLLLLLRETEHRYGCVVLVGHNPGMEDLAFAVDDGLGDADAIARMGRKFPTCGLAVFDIARPWEHLVETGGRLREFEVARGGG